jgi:hypothetical protein
MNDLASEGGTVTRGNGANQPVRMPATAVVPPAGTRIPPFLWADDYATLKDALDAHQSSGLPLYLTPGKTYTLSETYLYGGAGLRLYGGGGVGGRGGATIQATPTSVWNPAIPRDPNSMRAVMAFECAQCVIDGVNFDGAFNTRDCIRLEYAGENVFRNCDFGRSLRNGILLSRHRWQLIMPFDTGSGPLTGTVTGQSSGATAVIQRQADGNGAAGTLEISMPQLQTELGLLASTVPVFTLNETLQFSGGGTARYTGGTLVPLSQNDANTFEDCFSDGHGRLYGTADQNITGAWGATPVNGTVSWAPDPNQVTGTGTLITGTGTAFTQLDLEPGDPIFIGPSGLGKLDPSDCWMGTVGAVVDDTHIIAVYLFGQISGVNRGYTIGTGSGYTEHFAGDNNLNRIMRGLYRVTSSIGIRTAGLTGASIMAVQSDNNYFAGIVVGENGAVCNQASIIMPYLEGNYAGHIWVNTTADVTILGPQYGSGGGLGNIYRGAGGTILEATISDINRLAGGPGNPTTMGVLNGADGFHTEGKWSEDNVPHTIPDGATTITSMRSFVIVTVGARSDIDMTARPNIEAGTVKGQRLRLFIDGAHRVTLHDNTSQSDSGLQLGPNSSRPASITLAPGSVTDFVWVPPYWYLVGC